MIKIMFRRDHDYNWERNNPQLREGELVVVYTALGTKYKQGDGKKSFNDLQYVSNINSLKPVMIYTSGNSEAGALIDFLPEQEKYKNSRDPYGIFTRGGKDA